MADSQQFKHIPTSEPIFYETLAAAAKCYPDQAKEHFEATVTANERGRAHPVEAFLEDYATAGAA